MATPDPVDVPMADAMVPLPIALADTLIVLPVALSISFAAVLVVFRKRTDLQAHIAIPALALILAVDLGLLWQVAHEGPRTMMMGGWKPPFGIAFTVDLLGALFLGVAGFVALACGIYAVASVPGRERRYGFFPFLFLMMAGVSGALLTGDIFNLYVWFEVLLIAAFGLLILGSEREQLDGATTYGFLNLVATTLFLLTIGLVYGVFGTLNMADLVMKAAERGPDGTVLTLAALFLTSLGTKAAAFPLNAWLPASYHTPRFIVSALFAGLLTKVGIYALIRVLVMIFPRERAELATLIAWIAGATMILGALGALAQSDLRRLLNYVVIAGIGTILAGLAMPLPASTDLASLASGAGGTGVNALRLGLSGAIVYALHSIVVMTGLYLAAEIAAARAGSSSLHEMGGLWQRFPTFAVLVLILLLAVAGLPPFSGFWPKLTLVRATLAAGMPWLGAAILVSGLLLTITTARVFALAFWRPAASVLPRSGGVHPSRAPTPDRVHAAVPLVCLTLFVVAMGLWPEPLARLALAAADGVIHPAAYVSSVFGGAR